MFRKRIRRINLIILLQIFIVTNCVFAQPEAFDVTWNCCLSPELNFGKRQLQDIFTHSVIKGGRGGNFTDKQSGISGDELKSMLKKLGYKYVNQIESGCFVPFNTESGRLLIILVSKNKNHAFVFRERAMVLNGDTDESIIINLRKLYPRAGNNYEEADVGFCSFLTNQIDKHGEIGLFDEYSVVVKRYNRKNLGTALLALAMEIAFERGMKEVRIFNPQKTLYPLCEKLGFDFSRLKSMRFLSFNFEKMAGIVTPEILKKVASEVGVAFEDMRVFYPSLAWQEDKETVNAAKMVCHDIANYDTMISSAFHNGIINFISEDDQKALHSLVDKIDASIKGLQFLFEKKDVRNPRVLTLWEDLNSAVIELKEKLSNVKITVNDKNARWVEYFNLSVDACYNVITSYKSMFAGEPLMLQDGYSAMDLISEAKLRTGVQPIKNKKYVPKDADMRAALTDFYGADEQQRNEILTKYPELKDSLMDVVVRIDPDVVLYLNPMLFKNVIKNLNNNAIENMGRTESGFKRFELDFSQAGNTTTITVANTGQIKEHLLEYDASMGRQVVFCPGKTTKQYEEGLHGLGLSSVYEIVKAHGGSIRAENMDGQAVFTIELNKLMTDVVQAVKKCRVFSKGNSRSPKIIDNRPEDYAQWMEYLVNANYLTILENLEKLSLPELEEVFTLRDKGFQEFYQFFDSEKARKQAEALDLRKTIAVLNYMICTDPVKIAECNRFIKEVLYQEGVSLLPGTFLEPGPVGMSI